MSGIADRLRQVVETVTDPTAAEAEVEAIRAAAEQRAAEADQWRADAEAAAEEMVVQMDAAQARAGQAEAARAAAEADRDAAIGQVRQDAATRIGAAEADRDAAIEQARAGLASRSALPRQTGTRPSHGPRRQNRPPGWRSRKLPARRPPSKPPGPRPAVSAPARRRC